VKYLPRSHTGFYDPSTHIQRPVVALDIDGTMANYHEHFTSMAEAYLGRSLPPAWEFTGEVSFASHLGLAKATYRRIKLAYRQGGYKRSMPAQPGVSLMSRRLREEGAVVVICTTRPFLQLDVVEPDTRHWLKRNGVQYDAIISGERKYRDLVRTFAKERIIAVYEDLPEQASVCESLGIPLFLRDRSYNQSPALGISYKYGFRVHDAEDFNSWTQVEILEWKDKQCNSSLKMG
jgi:hypothetical protein